MTWPIYRLGEVIESYQSGFACGDKGVADGFKHLRMNNIHADGRIDLSLVRTVPPELATARYRLEPDDVLVCTTNSGKLVGKSALFGVAGDYAFSNHLTRLRVRRDIADPAFVQKQLWFKWVHGEIEPLCKHWVNQSTLPKEELLDLDVALPSLEEQRLISKTLDHVAVRLDDTRTRLDTIPAILKRFRMSVLAAASEGRIVGLGPDELGASCKFGDVLREMRNGISRKPGFEPPGIPILRISAVRTGTVELSDVRYLSEPTDKERQFSLENGDLLFTRYNGNLDLVGVCGVVRGLLDGQSVLYPDKLIRVRVSDSVLPEWVEIFLSAPGSREMIMSQSKSSAGQNGISGTDIKLLPFIVPSIEIQTKIVKRVRVMFEQADAIEARYRKAQAFTDKLMPSVLAKAFRGELVEQGAEEIQHG